MKKKLLAVLLVAGFILAGVSVASAAPLDETIVLYSKDPGGGGH